MQEEKHERTAETACFATTEAFSPQSPVRTAAGTIDPAQGVPYVVIPEKATLQNLESLLLNPVRKRAEVTVTETDSFVFYVKKHGHPKESLIYASVDTGQDLFALVAVIDDHGSEIPHWREHRCHFSPPLSTEWSRWLGLNKKTMSQSEFAAWLEDNLPDIAMAPDMPTSSEILQMALAFEANSGKRYCSKAHLQSGGISLKFVDEDNDESHAIMKVFERFTIDLPVFDGSRFTYLLEARLKFRETSGRLGFWYELIRPDRIFRTAVADELGKIGKRTGLSIILGKP